MSEADMWSFWCPYVNLIDAVVATDRVSFVLLWVSTRSYKVQGTACGWKPHTQAQGGFTHRSPSAVPLTPVKIDKICLSAASWRGFHMPFICFNYLFCYINKKPNILFTHRDLCNRFTYFFIMCSKLHSKRLTPILQLMLGMWFVHFICFEHGFLLKLYRNSE